MATSGDTPLNRARDRANGLLSGRDDIGLERRDDGWIIRPYSAPMIQVFGGHTYLVAPTEAERAAAAVLGVRTAAGSGPLKVAAGSRAELSLVAGRLAAAGARRAAPASEAAKTTARIRSNGGSTAKSHHARKAKSRTPQLENAAGQKVKPPKNKPKKRKKQRAVAKAKAAQTGLPGRKLTKAQRAELRKQAAEMAVFFTAAGVAARVQNDDFVVNGKKVVSVRALWGLRLAELERLRDRIAAAACAHEFIDAMKRNGPALGEHLRAFYVREQRGFEIRNGDDAIALICAGKARVYGGAAVEGNFLTDGKHWEKLRRRIAQLEAERARAAEAPTDEPAKRPVVETTTAAPKRRIRIDGIPEGLEADLVDAALEASRRIRLERQFAFDRPVTLESELGDLTLSPIVGNPDYLRVPFVFSRRGERIEGDIALTGHRDPIPVHIDDEAAGDLLASIWAASLLGLADATCFDLHQPERREPTLTSGPSRRRPRGARAAFRPMAVKSKRDIWPDHLLPIGSWARYSGAFVSGHRRRLHEGWSASKEAVENAHRVGIRLNVGETWVKPHSRGLPSNLDIRFLWRVSEPLLASAGVQKERP